MAVRKLTLKQQIEAREALIRWQENCIKRWREDPILNLLGMVEEGNMQLKESKQKLKELRNKYGSKEERK